MWKFGGVRLYRTDSPNWWNVVTRAAHYQVGTRNWAWGASDWPSDSQVVFRSWCFGWLEFRRFYDAKRPGSSPGGVVNEGR